MAFGNNSVSVPGTAVKICSVGPAGALVQNLGSVVVTLGGAGVTVGKGPTLPINMTSPIFVPGTGNEAVGIVGSPDVDTCDLYGIGASAGPTSVVFASPA